jgi:hypothetical protein
MWIAEVSRRTGVVAYVILAATTGIARAQDTQFEPSASDFGGAGLLQTRTARFWPDGQADVAFSRVFPYERYNLTLQALPWLEATFRYTSITNRSFDGGTSVFSGSSFKDRAFDGRLKLLSETRFRPQIAVGFQDALGTGLFSGEYVVASKRYYDLDFSLGLGWGYNAGSSRIRNPLISLSDSFATRGNAAAQGGTPVVGSWFSGPNMSFFGGVEYQTPLKGLSLKLEYDPNNYQAEPNSNVLLASSHLNFGFNYRPFEWLELSAARERGTQWMARVSLRANFNAAGVAKLDPPPPVLLDRSVLRSSLAAPPNGGRGQIVSDSIPERVGSDEAIDALERNGIFLESASYIEGALSLVFLSSGAERFGTEDVAVALNQFVDAAFPDATSLSVQFTDGQQGEELRHAGFNAPNTASPPPVPDFVMAKKIFAELDVEGLPGLGFERNSKEAILYFSPTKYRQIARSLGRAARIVANNIPPEIELITLVTMTGGMETSRVTISRLDLDAAVAAEGSSDEIWARADISMPNVGGVPRYAIRNNEIFPAFGFGISPNLRQHIGSRDGFYLYQLWLALSGSVQLNPALSLSGTIGFDITNNFDRLTVEPPASTIPRVRSFVKEYLQKGEDNLVRLQADYLKSPFPDVYTRLSIGYFEEMYGGVGGEVLYRPFGSRFAAGVDLNYVRQREFEQRFGFRDYTVLTGHTNLYYDIPYQGLLAQAHVGRFLAGDFGARFQLSRLFAGGVRVGAWATLTNISFAEFGEGSFDKGFFIVIPFDLLSVRSTTRTGAFSFRPLTKDGGQSLGIRPRLYDVTAGGNLNNIAKDWDRFLD